MRLPIGKKTLLGLPLIFLCILLGFFITVFFSDKPFLFPEKGATWIYVDRPFIMEAQREAERVSYRKRFNLESAVSAATLTVRSMKASEVYLDGRRISPVRSDLRQWKESRVYDLSGVLMPGTHEIVIRVFNGKGPAVLLAYCEPIGLLSGPDWEASYDELLWTRAVSVDKKKEVPELTRHFVTTGKAFISLLPFYVPLFLAIFFLTLVVAFPGGVGRKARRFVPSPSGMRWLLLVFWVVLAINNAFKIYLDVGMDVQQHYEYIEYVSRLGRVPLATEGWQMFQSPLYYIISALAWSFPLSKWFDMTSAMMLLRIIPLLCGLLQVELAYRATKYVFPGRNDLQIWGTVIGGLLPMNLYISQVVGNEPLAGLFSSGAIVMGFAFLASERERLPERYFIIFGGVLGLALLTKVSAVLLIPPVVAILILVLQERGQSPKYISLRVLVLLGMIFVVSGWYYIRNWMELGRPFIGGWESTFWWQDPGYRTISDFLTFGQSLSMPIYSAVQGFWDSVYSTLWLDGGLSGTGVYRFRPPWRYDFMLSEALLSLVPTAGILIGILITLGRPLRRESRAQWFSVCCIGVYFAALMYLYLTVPVYSTAKATYTLGLIPCYAVLCVTGLDRLSKNNLLRAIINACIACWAISAYCAYFVL